MKRISIPCAGLTLLVLSSPGLAQSASDSLSSAGKGGPAIAPVVSAAMARAHLQPGSRLAAEAVVDSATARRHIVAGAMNGLALGAIGVTVRDLARGDRRGRSVGTDGAIIVSAALIGALVNYTIHTSWGAVGAPPRDR